MWVVQGSFSSKTKGNRVWRRHGEGKWVALGAQSTKVSRLGWSGAVEGALGWTAWVRHFGGQGFRGGAGRRKEGGQATSTLLSSNVPVPSLPMGVALVVFSGFCFKNERGRGNPAARSSRDNTNQHPGALRVRYRNSCVWSSSGESVVLYENPSMQLAQKPGGWAPIYIPSSRINSQMPRTWFSVQAETPVLTLCTAQWF